MPMAAIRAGGTRAKGRDAAPKGSLIGYSRVSTECVDRTLVRLAMAHRSCARRILIANSDTVVINQTTFL
jgi:hypothetical protein